MKITITKEFTSVEAAYAFLERLTPGPAVQINITPPTAATVPLASPAPLDGLEHGEQPKRPRKPRNDAGQPRGAYKPRGAAEPAAPATIANPGEVDASAAAGARVAPPLQAASPGAASPSAAPAKNPAPEPSQAAQAPVAADLTETDIRATLSRLNAVPGKGMEACIASIRSFGVERISDLPKEKYADFTKYVLGQLPKAA